jgi:type IV secretory pathway VirB2 component (pilin)
LRHRYILTGFLFALVAFLLLCPEVGLAQDLGSLQTKSDSAVSWIKTAVHAILVVAVIGSGVMAAFGRMSWATVGQVIIGAVVAGLATEVVDALYGSGG